MKAEAAERDQMMREAVDFLYGLPKYTKKNGLGHTRKLMGMLKDPCADRKIIHVAGSNGKGSVCSFIYQMLLAGGKTAAMFTSPHLTDIRERFRVNGRLVTEEEFLHAFGFVSTAVNELTKSGEAHPTFFEFVYAMGMVMFEEAHPEYVILETGLGGRLDATNSFETPALCVITPVSLEHREILGDTVEEIAGEKAGIIKKGVPLVFAADDDEAAAVIRTRARELKCPAEAVRVLKTDENKAGGWRLSGPALYQAGNAALAIEAVHLLGCVSDEDMQRGLLAAAWPGRMEEVLPDVWLDGAHNPAGIKAFSETVREMAAGDEHAPLLLFSMLADKDIESSASMLTEGVKWELAAVTAVPGERGADPERTADFFKRQGAVRVVCFSDCGEAFEYMRARRKPGQKLFCTGSLYFTGTLKKLAMRA